MEQQQQKKKCLAKRFPRCDRQRIFVRLISAKHTRSFQTYRSTLDAEHMNNSPDEYLHLRWLDAAWLSYAAIVCGCINGASVHGLFRTASTHFTGTMTRFSISVAGQQRVGWLTTAGAGDSSVLLASIMLGFGVGAFPVGLVPAPAPNSSTVFVFQTSLRHSHASWGTGLSSR